MKITHKFKSVAHEQAATSLLPLHAGSCGQVEPFSSASPSCIAGDHRNRSDIFNMSYSIVISTLCRTTALVRSYEGAGRVSHRNAIPNLDDAKEVIDGVSHTLEHTHLFQKVTVV